MERQTNIQQLRAALDEAVVCAEQAGLTFVVHILDMALLEVDQSSGNNIINMPTSRFVGKRR